MKEIKIDIPEGYEIDTENSTFTNIKFKPISSIVINTLKDLLESKISINGWKLVDNSIINVQSDGGYNIVGQFMTKKEAFSQAAASEISRIMPYYGGAITNKEWGNADITKFTIYRSLNKISTGPAFSSYSLLAFRTAEDRDRFLKHNEKLVRDYLMLD